MKNYFYLLIFLMACNLKSEKPVKVDLLSKKTLQYPDVDREGFKRYLDSLQKITNQSLGEKILAVDHFQLNGIEMSMSMDSILESLGKPIKTAESRAIEEAGEKTIKEYYYKDIAIYALDNFPISIYCLDSSFSTPDGFRVNMPVSELSDDMHFANKSGEMYFHTSNSSLSLRLLIVDGIIRAIILSATAG